MSANVMDQMREIQRQQDRIKAEARSTDEQLSVLADRDTLTAGEQRQFDDLCARSDKLVETAKALKLRNRELLSEGVKTGELKAYPADGPIGGGDDRSRSGTNEVRSAGLRAVAYSDAPDHAKELATTMIETESPRANNIAARWAAATAAPAYFGAFMKLIADPTRGHMKFTDQEREAFAQVEEVRSYMSLTDANGGFMVPFTLDPSILITSAGSINPIRQIASVSTIATDSWNGVTSAGVTAEWIAENTQVADASPTVAQPSIPVHKADAFVAVSFEAFDDIKGFQSEVGKLLLDAKEQLEATAFWSGSGVGQPTGIETALAGGSSVVTPTTSEAFTGVADSQKLLQQLPPRFRQQAQFVAELSTINAIENDLGGGSNANKPSILSIDGSGNMRLLLKPLHEFSLVDPASAINAAATATNNILVVGAWENYKVIDRIGATIEVIPNLFGANDRPTGSRGLLLWWRVGADSVVDNAFRMLSIVTAA